MTTVYVTNDQASLTRFMEWLEGQQREAAYLLTTESDPERVKAASEAFQECGSAVQLVHLYLGEQTGYGVEPHGQRLEGYPTGQAQQSEHLGA